MTASSQAVWGRWVASTLAGSALWACVACGTGGASGGSHDTVPSPDGGDGGAPTTDLDADLHGDLGRAGDATSSPDALEVAGGADGAGRPPSEDVSGAAADAPRAWTAVVADLPGAALGGWRAPGGDVWVVGARGAGQVPLLLRRAAGVWSWMDPGVEADLWAVHGASDARVWLAGAAGTLVARDASGGGTVAVATGVTGTLRALWVATDEELWAVGGPITPGTAPGALLHVVGGVVTDHVSGLPAAVGAGAPMLGVWGASTSDVWAVGEGGVVAHWDGSELAVDVIAPGATLSAVAGDPVTGDVVVAGGFGDARVWRRVGGAWSEMSPPSQPHLHAVDVDASGRVLVAGLVGAALEWSEPLGWGPLPASPLARDWRAAWWSPEGAVWLAGGALLSAAALDQGAVVCYGPAASCGEAAGPALVPPVPAAGGGDPDVEVPDAADAADAAEAVGADGEAEVVDDAGPSAVGDTPSPSDGPLALELGRVSAAGSFAPLGDGDTVEIVQGAQGFIHLEIGVRFEAIGLPEPDAFVAASGAATLGGEEIAFGTVPKLPVTGAEGVFMSRWNLPLLLIFANGDADPAPYIGDPPIETLAEACVTVSLEDGTLDTLCRTLSLVDLE